MQHSPYSKAPNSFSMPNTSEHPRLKGIFTMQPMKAMCSFRQAVDNHRSTRRTNTPSLLRQRKDPVGGDYRSKGQLPVIGIACNLLCANFSVSGCFLDRFFSGTTRKNELSFLNQCAVLFRWWPRRLSRIIFATNTEIVLH